MAIINERRQSGEDRGDLLSMLLAARDEDTDQGMDDDQLHDEAMTLFLAGHETTANALSFAFYLLAKHPEVEQRLLAKLKDIVGERLPTAKDVSKLPYLDHVLKETMRLYPPAETPPALEPMITLRPRDGIPMRVRLRQEAQLSAGDVAG